MLSNAHRTITSEQLHVIQFMVWRPGKARHREHAIHQQSNHLRWATLQWLQLIRLSISKPCWLLRLVFQLCLSIVRKYQTPLGEPVPEDTSQPRSPKQPRSPIVNVYHPRLLIDSVTPECQATAGAFMHLRPDSIALRFTSLWLRLLGCSLISGVIALE